MANVAKSSGRGSKPGERRGGRKKGTPNKKTAEVIKAVELTGITPLEFMLDVMRAPIPDDVEAEVKVAMIGMRFEAAKAAAPYVHARLAGIQVSGELTHTNVARLPPVEKGAKAWAEQYSPTHQPPARSQ